MLTRLTKNIQHTGTENVAFCNGGNIQTPCSVTVKSVLAMILSNEACVCVCVGGGGCLSNNLTLQYGLKHIYFFHDDYT